MRHLELRLLSFRLIACAIRTLLICFLVLSSNVYSKASLDASCTQFVEDMRQVQQIVAPHCSGNSMDELNDCFQKHLLRVGERFEQTNEGTSSQEFAELVKSFIYLINPVPPKQSVYDVTGVLGSLFSNMQTRFTLVLKLLDEEHYFTKRIVFLGSNRNLDPKWESEAMLATIKVGGLMRKCPSNDIPFPTTETEAIHYILSCSDPLPNMPLHKVLDTTAPAGKKRATTEDTLITLVNDKEVFHPAYTYLFVSSQPFALLQEAIIRGVLGPDVQFDICADNEYIVHHGFDSIFAQKNLKDNLARLLYQVKKNLDEGRSKSCPLLRPLDIPHTEEGRSLDEL